MKLTTPTRAAGTLTVALVVLVATSIFAQQLTAKRSADEQTVKLVRKMITQYHIKQSEIDDATAAMLFDAYLKQLDPQKMYFTQADIDQLSKFRGQLADHLDSGNVAFANEAFELYLKRLDERVALANTLIDAEHDFTIEESLVLDAKDLPWPKDEEAAAERWRKRIKYDLLTLRLDDTDIDEARDRLHRRYENIRNTMKQTENGEKLEMYLSALAHCFDPHSSYMSPESREDFEIQMRLSLDGIGAALRSEDGYTIVASIVPGGAAASDGRLKVNDKIIGVAQEDGEMVDVVEMKLSKVVRHIRGPRGTKVILQVKTGDSDEVKRYELTRQKIELKESEVKGEIIKTGKRLDGRQARVGVINIPSFYRDFGGAQEGLDDFKSTVRDVQAVLNDFENQGGVDAVVIDLRTNGGGALKEAIDVSGLFINGGPVVQVKELDGTVKVHESDNTGIAYSGPLVVLTNRLSASASEIFAGVIKDYQRGIIVGDQTTHGKGTVQNVMRVPSQLLGFLGGGRAEGALKLTISQFYRINGDSTQARGVPSDVVLPSLIDHMDLGESFLDNALEFDKIKPAKFTPVGQIPSELLTALQQASQGRVGACQDFQETQGEIKKYVERKNRKTVSLHEETLRRERAAEKKARAETDDLDQENRPENGPIFPNGHYNDEVLQITLDYIDRLKEMKTAGK